MNMIVKAVVFLFIFCNLEVARHIAGKIDLFISVLFGNQWNKTLQWYMERQVVVFLKENKLNPQIYLFINIIEFL